MPRHCAVCCQGFSGPGSDLPRRVSGLSSYLPRFGRDATETHDITDDLPEYVNLLVHETDFQEQVPRSERDFEETLYGLSEGETRQLRGVAVFKDTESDE